MQLPTRASYVVIGAGIHGPSTARHLAEELKARGRGSGEEVIDNAYVIADSNHGYRIGVGALVAKELLEPFRVSCYETGELHPTSHSPFPWN